MTTLNEFGNEYARSMNRDYDRKKQTVVKLLRFGWSLFSYYKGTPTIDGDLTTVPTAQAIAALSKQIDSGLKDQKAEAATMEGIDLAAGWVMDLLRPSEMQAESHFATLAMCRGLLDTGPMAPMPQPMPQPAPQPAPHPVYTAPRPPIGPGYRPPQRQVRRPVYRGGRLANENGQWVYLANDAADGAANYEE
jgi:hypothetical protein